MRGRPVGRSRERSDAQTALPPRSRKKRRRLSLERVTRVRIPVMTVKARDRLKGDIPFQRWLSDSRSRSFSPDAHDRQANWLPAREIKNDRVSGRCGTRRGVSEFQRKNERKREREGGGKERDARPFARPRDGNESHRSYRMHDSKTRRRRRRPRGPLSGVSTHLRRRYVELPLSPGSLSMATPSLPASQLPLRARSVSPPPARHPRLNLRCLLQMDSAS